MKSLRLFKDNTKKGAASIYVVVFATILFGVITLSFTKIILSEASQSSDDDLSRSAYDTALAGVEDAKIMVNRYYDCLQKNGANSTECENNFNVFGGDCEDGTFPLARKLHGVDGEVFIQETGSGSDDEADEETSANQAYTCVLISDVTPDYRGTLTTDTRTKVIPININGSGTSSTESAVSNIKKIRFSWYSDLNQGSNSDDAFRMRDKNSNGVPTLPDSNNATIPPTMQLTLIKTPKDIKIEDFQDQNNKGGIVYSTMIFVPTNEAESRLNVSHDQIIASGNTKEVKKVDDMHTPFAVLCNTATEFACVIELDTNEIITGSNDNVMLIASLPYGDALTDFAVTLFDGADKQINFKGAQISVDSTGRTNQLYRRVETRLEPADLFYPYPQYALEVNGGDDDSIKKNFWVTANCWTEAGLCNNNGNI